jgi:low affinity Fe/Cu permease
MNLATVEVKAFCHAMLTRCRFRVPPDYNARHTYVPLGVVSGAVRLGVEPVARRARGARGGVWWLRGCPMPDVSMRDSFHSFASRVSTVLGTPGAFLLALCTILAWVFTGPIFHFSDTWQLVINTGTTIITFLMVFLIQNTQTRDAKALHLKLDELIRSHHRARNELIELEGLSEQELERLHAEFQRARDDGRLALKKGA